LSFPGLLNHLTGTLEILDIDADEKNENLLSTIRCPRNLGQITERLPKPQYQPMKRSNSMAIETAPKIDVREDNLRKLVKNQEKSLTDSSPKIATHTKIGERSNRKKPSVILASLPTIEEDCVDENTPEKYKKRPHLALQQEPKGTRHVRNGSQI